MYLTDEDDSEAYTNAVDIWSVGVIAFTILTSKPLFQDRRKLRHYYKGEISIVTHGLYAVSYTHLTLPTKRIV